MLQLHIGNAVESAFEDALQSSYFNLDQGLKTAMFILVKQVVGEIVRSASNSRITKAEMRNLLQTKSAADIITRLYCPTLASSSKSQEPWES